MPESWPLSIKKIHITDPFWSAKRELIRKEVIPYQWEILNDRVPEAEPSYCMHNFRVAGALAEKKRTMGEAFIPPKYTYRGFQALPEDPRAPKDDEFYGFLYLVQNGSLKSHIFDDIHFSPYFFINTLVFDETGSSSGKKPLRVLTK